jgi:hypothetical protein
MVLRSRRLCGVQNVVLVAAVALTFGECRVLAATSADLDGLPDVAGKNSAGNLYFTDLGDKCIRKVSAATGAITHRGGPRDARIAPEVTDYGL